MASEMILHKPSNLNRALAIANLLNLGRSPDESFNISKDWAQKQFAQSTKNIIKTLSPIAIDKLSTEIQQSGKMYASFHFSLYPLLYLALSRLSSTKKVYSLIGEQDEVHRVELNKLASQFGFQIEFIQSNPSMIKTLRKVISGHLPGILLLDIPWSKDGTQPDITYQVPGGHFQGNSSLERLLKIIDPNYEILLVKSEGNNHRIYNAGTVDLQTAFRIFGQLLQSDPAEYERLHQFHRFFKFDILQNCAITFCVQNQRYILHSKTMQAWQITLSIPFEKIIDGVDVVSADSKVVNYFSKQIGHELEYVISI